MGLTTSDHAASLTLTCPNGTLADPLPFGLQQQEWSCQETLGVFGPLVQAETQAQLEVGAVM